MYTYVYISIYIRAGEKLLALRDTNRRFYLLPLLQVHTETKALRLARWRSFSLLRQDGCDSISQVGGVCTCCKHEPLIIVAVRFAFNVFFVIVLGYQRQVAISPRRVLVWAT